MKPAPSFALKFSFVVVATLVAACSSGTAATTSDGGAPSSSSQSGTCASAEDCAVDVCKCGDGTELTAAAICFQSACSDTRRTCESMCSNAGGVTKVEPQPNVVGSPECDAFIAKAKGLGCSKGSYNARFFCGESTGECDASKKAFLQCQIDKAKWACDDTGWSVSGSCSTFKELCEKH